MRTIGFETITVADTAVGFTTATQEASDYAVLSLESGQVRWRDDGTDPTATVGHLLNVGDALMFDGEMLHVRFIRTGATSGSLQATYYQRG